MEEVVKYLKALVALQLRQATAQEDGQTPMKVEFALSLAGLTARDIAELSGRKEATVAKAITRARAAAAAEMKKA